MKYFLAIICLFLAVLSEAEGSNGSIDKKTWSFYLSDKGSFSRQDLQKGYQVYKEVCSTCHGMRLLSYRNLYALGFSPAQVKAIAAQHTVKDGPNDEGEMFDRPAIPSDRFVSPYANDKAARAANAGVVPPDLSVITKARPGGIDYVYALLTGYGEPKKGVKAPADNLYYNKHFPGGWIAMTPPLQDGLVSFSDGSKASVENMAKYVAIFLAWASEPEMEERHQLGFMVLFFLSIFAIIMFFVTRRIWKRVH